METYLPDPQPEKKKGYSYDLKGFTVNGNRRESSAQLKVLLRSKSDIIDRLWIFAQLRHYGIKRGTNNTKFEALALLRKSASEGLVSAR